MAGDGLLHSVRWWLVVYPGAGIYHRKRAVYASYFWPCRQLQSLADHVTLPLRSLRGQGLKLDHHSTTHYLPSHVFLGTVHPDLCFLQNLGMQLCSSSMIPLECNTPGLESSPSRTSHYERSSQLRLKTHICSWLTSGGISAVCLMLGHSLHCSSLPHSVRGELLRLPSYLHIK